MREEVSRACGHGPRMSNDVPHPYSVEIHRLDRPAGHFGRTLHKGGKLMEPSDRPNPSEDRARESVMKALDGYLMPKPERGR